MERLYRALAWLSGMAIVIGLVYAVMFTAQALSYYANVPFIPEYNDVFTGFAPGGYGGDLPSNIKSATFLLVSGATLLAVALAWADRRWSWLIALIIVTILGIIWPAGVGTWAIITIHTLPPVPVTIPLEVMTFSIFVAPLIPVVMALILALTRRQPAPSVTPGAALG